MSSLIGKVALSHADNQESENKYGLPDTDSLRVEVCDRSSKEFAANNAAEPDADSIIDFCDSLRESSRAAEGVSTVYDLLDMAFFLSIALGEC